MYDPTTSTEPLPPSMQSNSQGQTSATSSQTWEEISADVDSPSSAEDLSPETHSGLERSESDIISFNRASNAVGRGLTDPVPQQISATGLSLEDLPSTSTVNAGQAPPGYSNPGHSNRDDRPPQPPSLTLSLFTLPSHLSLARVVAVVGINFVLPFINGVMLGFGEIFARETVKVGRLFWRGEREVFGYRRFSRRDDVDAQGLGQGSGSRGVASVGLSGSGGFP